MNYVARRWNWTRELQLSHDTKYVIVKEESINEVVDGIPENAMMANASGGCVLLFNFIKECAANDELIHVREDHLPSHQGIRRKMLGTFSTMLMFEDFAFFITPEISSSRRHERDYALLRNLLQLTCSKLCSSLEELRSSTATYKVALRSTATSDFG
uniref:ATP-dependent protease subunit HslV n=1 Tax=Lygus hesperus TaxID=30085 RepID=A0A0A9X6N6_LYGHE